MLLHFLSTQRAAECLLDTARLKGSAKQAASLWLAISTQGLLWQALEGAFGLHVHATVWYRHVYECSHHRSCGSSPAAGKEAVLNRLLLG